MLGDILTITAVRYKLESYAGRLTDRMCYQYYKTNMHIIEVEQTSTQGSGQR